MRCAPLTRLALALPDDWTTDQLAAAERAQLDLLTLPAGAPASSTEAVLEATTRIGVAGWAATGAQPERTGVIDITGGADVLVAVLESAQGPAVPEADVLLVPASVTAAEVQALRDAAAGRTVRVFATIDLVLDGDPGRAAARAAAAEAASDTLVAGTPAQVVAELGRRKAAAVLDGFWLHLADPALDLPLLCTGVVPTLRENDNFRRGYESRSLRGNLALPPRGTSPVGAGSEAGGVGARNQVSAPAAGRAAGRG